jgi:hypothetical protein
LIRMTCMCGSVGVGLRRSTWMQGRGHELSSVGGIADHSHSAIVRPYQATPLKMSTPRTTKAAPALSPNRRNHRYRRDARNASNLLGSPRRATFSRAFAMFQGWKHNSCTTVATPIPITIHPDTTTSRLPSRWTQNHAARSSPSVPACSRLAPVSEHRRRKNPVTRY